MTTQVSGTSVVTSTTVEVWIDRAFEVFIDMGRWWIEDHHLIENFASMEVQRHVGGRIIDHATDGTTNSWAEVIVFDPPTHFAFRWEINPRWELEPDPARHSEVHVTFEPEGDARTVVTLEHRHLDRHGAGWEDLQASVGAPGGWQGHLEAFAAFAIAA